MEIAFRPEDALGLIRFSTSPGGIDDRLWYVVKEIGQRVELVRGTAIAFVLPALRLGLTGVAPPLTDRFPRIWNHGIHQHDQRRRNLLPNEGSSKAA